MAINETLITLPAAGAWSDELIMDVSEARYLSIGAQYISAAATIIGNPGQVELKLESFLDDLRGASGSLGQENERDQSPAGSGKMVEDTTLEHQVASAFGGALSDVEAIWAAAPVAADQVRLRAREIGDVANPGHVGIRHRNS